MISPLRFSIVTVCYRQDKYLDDFLQSTNKLESEKVSLRKVIVVDNYGSCKDTLEYGSNPDVRIIRSENVGYLRGLGIGVDYACSDDIDFVVVCNPDLKFMTKIEDDVLQALRGLWVVAPQVVDLDGRQQNPNRVSPISISELLVWELMARSYHCYTALIRLKGIYNDIAISRRNTLTQQECEPDGPIFLPHGSCMLMSTDLLKRADFFNEEIFLWGEEAVIGWTARKVGSGVKYVSSLRIEHASHSSTSNIPERDKYLIWRNSWRRYRKYLYRK